MKNKSCDVILDLLPLYVDGVCSEESSKFVEEHISKCESCKKLLEIMKSDFNISGKSEERTTRIQTMFCTLVAKRTDYIL